MEWWSMAKFGQFWELAQPFIVGVVLFAVCSAGQENYLLGFA